MSKKKKKELLTITEYAIRKNVRPFNVRYAITKGKIVPENTSMTSRLMIDWNKYKDFEFISYYKTENELLRGIKKGSVVRIGSNESGHCIDIGNFATVLTVRRNGKFILQYDGKKLEIGSEDIKIDEKNKNVVEFGTQDM